MKTLRLSEHFYSLQGEGKTMGVPAVFLRFGGCVLHCPWCDTLEIWKKWTTYTLAELVELVLHDYSKQLDSGAHLVVTGGEPLMQAEGISELIAVLRQRIGSDLFVEVETAATLPFGKLASLHSNSASKVNQWNISLKTLNSKQPENLRKAVFDRLTVLEESTKTFKFVVEQESDIVEIQSLVESMWISPDQVWLMPLANTRDELVQRSPMVAQLAKNMGYQFSSRLQLAIWDKAVGV